MPKVLNLKHLHRTKTTGNEMTEITEAKPAYFMVQVKAKSLEELSVRYAQAAIASLMNHGGQMIAGTPMPMVLEGKWEGSWAAILRFPTMEMAQAWYESSEYKPLKELRINELTESGQILLVEGM
jgi:uncharacterized protein (DUF1330 family)